MVDDLVVANATTEEHRASMLRVFTLRFRSVYPSVLVLATAHIAISPWSRFVSGAARPPLHSIAALPSSGFPDAQVQRRNSHNLLRLCVRVREILPGARSAPVPECGFYDR